MDGTDPKEHTVTIPVPDSPDAAQPATLPGASEEVELLEVDETVPPRPEEEIADVARSVPDPDGHGGTPEAGVTARELP
ncbi:hypothetical protein Q760_10075 [Cellulomonas cellasea DSM 20118]|uniref:Uncharacterized protein n=1 Tax=Cellulomonas cellasea DSM 20118 TaxID=1408250 RepID=A0A0A0BAX1_9CELL|nr:hypothetical protein Q760_10075 [Cellulomonas cellasea DSM 20118]